MADPGTLYVVATPIGNLEDITIRALRVLREVGVIACEDTRVTRKLLSAQGIATPTTAYHAHSGPSVRQRLIDRLCQGESVALVTDAGTPGVSDPGEALVADAWAAGLTVTPIPGASALTAVLSASGLSTSRVLFLGFLPRDAAAQREALAPARSLAATLVLYESPRRLQATLQVARDVFGDRAACVAREVTKAFETFEHGRLSELVERFAEPPPGEVVVVIGPGAVDDETDPDAPLKEAQRLLAAGHRPADVAKTIAGAFGLARKEAYRLVLAAKD